MTQKLFYHTQKREGDWFLSGKTSKKTAAFSGSCLLRSFHNIKVLHNQ